jgi:hypothetical protein
VTKAVLAACVVLVPAVAVGIVRTPEIVSVTAVTVPVKVGDALGASSPSAVSARVVSVVTAALSIPSAVSALVVSAAIAVLGTATAVVTALVVKAVVASCVVLVRAAAVGPVGVPVKAGEAANPGLG